MKDLTDILELPSELYNHILNFIVLCIFTLTTIVVTSALLVFNDNLIYEKIIYVFFILLVFALFTLFIYKLKSAVPPKRPLNARLAEWLWVQFFKYGRFKIFIGKYRVPTFEPISEIVKKTQFGLYFFSAVQDKLKTENPSLYWAPNDTRCAARVFGSSSNPCIGVSAGLITKYRQEPELVKAYILHEFAHLTNKDWPCFCLISALLQSWKYTVLLSIVIAIYYSIPYTEESDAYGILYLILAFVATPLLLFIWAFNLRYASTIISLLESYADIKAANWMGEKIYFENLFLNDPKRKHRLRNFLNTFFGLKLNHLPPNERLGFVENPGILLEPKVTYFFLTGILLLIIQSNSITKSYRDSLVSSLFILPWTVILYAYFLNFIRWVIGITIFPHLFTRFRILKILFLSSLFISLPLLTTELVNDIFFLLIELAGPTEYIVYHKVIAEELVSLLNNLVELITYTLPLFIVITFSSFKIINNFYKSSFNELKLSRVNYYYNSIKFPVILGTLLEITMLSAYRNRAIEYPVMIQDFVDHNKFVAALIPLVFILIGTPLVLLRYKLTTNKNYK